MAPRAQHPVAREILSRRYRYTYTYDAETRGEARRTNINAAAKRPGNLPLEIWRARAICLLKRVTESNSERCNVRNEVK